MTTLNPKTTAFVFPGQGSQSVGMGRDLVDVYPVAQQTFEEADQILGFSLSKLMWAGPEDELNDTVNTQPALFVHSLAAYRVLSDIILDFQPAYVAGHSLGELSALAAAGALTFADGLRLVRTRGELMKQAGVTAPGGMAAILGLDIPVLDQICTEASTADDSVQVANDNCPGQVVISGAKAAVERAMELAKVAGARRALPLAVSIAAHSPLMAAAQQSFDLAVATARVEIPRVAVVGNVSAAPMASVEEIRLDLRAQLTSRVRWTETIQFMLAQGVDSFVEIGNGNVLTGLLKRTSRDATGILLGNSVDFTVFN